MNTPKEDLMAKELDLLRKQESAARAVIGNLRRMYEWHSSNENKTELQLLVEAYDKAAQAYDSFARIQGK